MMPAACAVIAPRVVAHAPSARHRHLPELARALDWPRYEALMAGLQSVIDNLPVGDRTAELCDVLRWRLAALRSEVTRGRLAC